MALRKREFVTISEPVLSIKNLSKTFPGQKALQGVALDVLPGEIHALVGANGSGKSTLIKCLSGYHQWDAGGEVFVGGSQLPVPHTSTYAHKMGLGFIHQDLGLIPSLSVLENFCVGRGFTTGPGYKIRWAVEAKKVQDMMTAFGRDISPRTLIRHIPLADRTIVAIVRALEGIQTSGRLLVLDEPTVALPHTEVERLFETIRRTARVGVGIIYVSHKLQEIFELADRVSVLKDGNCLGSFPVADLDQKKLVELITGRTVETYYPDVELNVGEDEILRTENLSDETVKGVNLSLRRGEIVGVAGLVGSGGSEVGRLLFGAQPRLAGKVWFKDREVNFGHPKEAIKSGIGLITNDRHRDGMFPKLTVGENITIADVQRHWRRCWPQKRAERRELLELIDAFQLTPPDPTRTMDKVSGGNQQKGIMAKWMRIKPDLLICDEPTQGVDIGAKTYIYGRLKQAAADGTTIVLISTEYKDLSFMCDRVLVMRDGHIVAELSGPQLTEESIIEQVCLNADPLPMSKNQINTDFRSSQLI